MVTFDPSDGHTVSVSKTTTNTDILNMEPLRHHPVYHEIKSGCIIGIFLSVDTV